MNTYWKRSSLNLTAALMAALPLHALASVLTVNDPGDPANPNAANCIGAAQACTLREALAAADETAAQDTILFDVDQTIYLTRKLVSTTPVTIDGGGDARLRVDQGYHIAVLPDRAKYSSDNVAVLQPVYSNPGNGVRYMIELYGIGSKVIDLEIDGSITPAVGESPVERVDYNSDGVTDLVLYSVESNGESVWPITGGILVDMFRPPWLECGPGTLLGDVEVSGNVLKNLGGTGISVAFHQQAVIADNEITGGAYPGPYTEFPFDGDGIYMFCGAAANVSGNLVEGYRGALGMDLMTATSINGNTLLSNSVGMLVNGASDVLGPNLIEGNEIVNNLDQGMKLLNVSYIHVSRNEVHHNGSNPDSQGGILVASSGWNSFDANVTNENSAFGIVLENSWSNQVTNHYSKQNGGPGIVLVNNSQENTLMRNKAIKNQGGIVMAVTENGAPFPANNTIRSNEARQNQGADMLDLDPVCDDTWDKNKFSSSIAASGACID